MTQVENRRLELNRVVPNFTLPALDGRQVSVREFKQRANLLILYLDTQRHGPERYGNYLSLLVENLSTFQELETQLLVVTSSPLERPRGHPGWGDLPFPVLSDSRGDMERSYLGSMAQVVGAAFVTDRYGALKAEMISLDEEELPDPREMIGWLQLIEIECPE